MEMLEGFYGYCRDSDDNYNNNYIEIVIFCKERYQSWICLVVYNKLLFQTLENMCFYRFQKRVYYFGVLDEQTGEEACDFWAIVDHSRKGTRNAWHWNPYDRTGSSELHLGDQIWKRYSCEARFLSKAEIHKNIGAALSSMLSNPKANSSRPTE